MKKYSFLIFSACLAVSNVNTKQISKAKKSWDAQAYAQGNNFQEKIALYFLEKYAIDVTDKTVIDIGCGTGNITAQLAEHAKHVHGIDACPNMIQFARNKYSTITNLTFENSLIEDLVTEEQFDMAVTFLCLHWVNNKQQALHNINCALQLGGNFFGIYQSTSDTEKIHMTVLKEMLQEMPEFQGQSIDESSGCFRITDEECKQLLQKNGFEIIFYGQDSFDAFISKEEYVKSIKPIIMSRPFMTQLSQEQQEQFFDTYMKRLLAKLPLQEDGTYIYPSTMWSSTIFYTRKVKNI